MNSDMESDFYGDEDEVQDLESRVSNFDPADYWRTHSGIVTALPATMKKVKREALSPAAAASPSPPPPPATLHNPYEGKTACAKQLGESVDEFLARLPPATTDVTAAIPWIYVANPYIPRQDRGGEEAPEEFGAQVSHFIRGGEERLELLGDFLREVEEKTSAGGRRGRPGPSKAVVKREVDKERAGCKNDLLMLAKAMKVRTGKWMLFIEPPSVNEVWAAVVRATVDNELGVAAKVAPREERGSRRERLICIYTYDFSDRDDAARVLNRMKQLNLVPAAGPGRRQIYYKADAYTHLGIASDNPWGLRVSLYSSNDIFSYIKERESMVREKPAKEEEKGAAAFEKMIKQEEDFDGGGWTF